MHKITWEHIKDFATLENVYQVDDFCHFFTFSYFQHVLEQI